LYAGTDDGVFVRGLSQTDTNWIGVGLKGKVVRTIYPHQVGPIGYAVTAGVQRAAGDTSSPLIYCTSNSDTSWTITDSGIVRSEVTFVRSIDGFLSPAICGETFAAIDGVYRRTPSSGWGKVYDIGGTINALKVHGSAVWIGGETGFFAPFIARSDNKGDSWNISFPNLGGDNACNSLEFSPSDTATIYAGMEGVVIKSANGGQTWDTTGLKGTPYYFFGVAHHPFTPILYAGGSTYANQFGLYQSIDEGKTWAKIEPPAEWKGIRCMTFIVSSSPIPEARTLLIGTMGDGVLSYEDAPVFVPQEREPMGNVLYQNHPNPFNPETRIQFSIPKTSRTLLRIYDVIGREVRTLVDRVVESGSYVIQWDGRDDDRLSVPSGVYFYCLSSGDFVSTKKMILIR
jgi:hypothetical protein